MTAAWQPAPIVGGAYTDDTRPWSVQDTVNWIPVKIERPGGRSESLLRCAPGALVFSIPGPAAPVRGMHDVEGRLFAVVGTSLYQLTATGVAIRWGEIPGVGMVSMAHNQIAGGNELVVANGSSGYVLNTVTEQFGQITDEGFPGFKVCDFSDGYIIGVEPQGRYWFHSDLADATSYNTFDRQEAESQPDRIVSLVVSHREVLVLGERTGEFFRNTGAAQGTFQRIDGTEMEVGCAATHSARRLDNSVIWLGNDGSVYRLNGYSPIRISTHAMEQAISRCNLAQAFAFTYEDRGHKIYYLTFPDGMTWGYDVATQEWTRRESFGLERWRMSCMARSNRQWFAGDYANGKIYRIDWSMPWENGEVIERRRISGVLHDNQNRVGIDAVEFVFNVGVGETGPGSLFPPQPQGPSISGDAPNWVEQARYPDFSYTLTTGAAAIRGTSVVAGSLPAGLAIGNMGEITGTPTIPGSYSFTIRVVDLNELWAEVTDTIKVAAVDVFIADVNINALDATVDGSYAGLILDGDVDGFTADDVFIIDKPAGLAYKAWSPWATNGGNPPGDGLTWINRFDVTNGIGTHTRYWGTAANGVPPEYQVPRQATADLAEAAVAGKQVVLTGSDYYKIWLYDTPVNDNRGGFSARIRKGTPAP